MMKMAEGYPLDQCALYACGSHSRLASRLQRSAPFLRTRAFNDTLYRTWNEPKASGGTRLIQAPREDLKIVQRRIADLLQRVLPPAYLACPVRGRSYVHNALRHKGAAEVRLLDVVDYFGRCDWRAVYAFFKRDLRCSPDVAWTLAGLTTRGGHLPQGSPCSPILSFFSYKDMWAEIAAKVESNGCKLSIYIDDITISGDHVPERLVWEVKEVLCKYGHSWHRGKERRRVNRPVEVTGIVLRPDKVTAPHRHYRKLLATRAELSRDQEPEIKTRLIARARSLESQIKHLQAL